MPYKIRISELADDDLNQLPPAGQNWVHRHLFDGLAVYASLLTHSSKSPLRRALQVTECDKEFDGDLWEVTIPILYWADEVHIEILRVIAGPRNIGETL